MAAICPGHSMPVADWDFGCSWIPIKTFLYKLLSSDHSARKRNGGWLKA